MTRVYKKRYKPPVQINLVDNRKGAERVVIRNLLVNPKLRKATLARLPLTFFEDEAHREIYSILLANPGRVKIFPKAPWKSLNLAPEVVKRWRKLIRRWQTEPDSYQDSEEFYWTYVDLLEGKTLDEVDYNV